MSGMRSVQSLMASLNGDKPRREYTPRDNEASAVYMSKKFIAYLANEDFFDEPVAPRMTRDQAETMHHCFALFIARNKIMSTPVGLLCNRHIRHFIANLFEIQTKGNHKFTKFDIVAMLPDYKGADHA